mgnify:CR=1 FL=1
MSWVTLATSVVGFTLGWAAAARFIRRYEERMMIEFVEAVTLRLRVSGWSSEAASAFVDEVIVDVRKRTAAIDWKAL